ncbi:hypothetical protein WMY93_026735 [Mugilogobius chulae]|uniref:Sulfotransferase n=1 Tax=Mugilogobius chulae TaxID=88201 RepID=A0AAW0MZE6_9GOBI
MTSTQYVNYQGYLLPPLAHTKESLEFAENFSVEDTDVFAVTFPKSGTVWMQEILPLILNSGDLTPVQTIPNWDRTPWLEETRLSIVVDQLKPLERWCHIFSTLSCQNPSISPRQRSSM